MEFANVVLLNKVDLASPADTTRLRSVLRALNPSARLLETTHCQVDLTEVLDSRRFNIDRAFEAAGWQQVRARAAYVISLVVVVVCLTDWQPVRRRHER